MYKYFSAIYRQKYNLHFQPFIELELALAEGAGLRGGYSTPDSLKRRDRFKMDRVPLRGSEFE